MRKAEQLIGTAGGNDTKTFENIEFGIPEVPSTHVDADGIGIGYFIMIEVLNMNNHLKNQLINTNTIKNFANILTTSLVAKFLNCIVCAQKYLYFIKF